MTNARSLSTRCAGVVTALALAACANDIGSPPAPSTAPTASAAPSAKPAAALASTAPLAKPKKGPLPSGLTTAVAATRKGSKESEAGIGVSMVTSGSDDPLIAYVDKGTDGVLGLKFVAWSRDEGKWKGPVWVDQIDELASGSRQLTLARDRTSSGLAIAYAKSSKEAWLATSGDGGTTWNKEKLPSEGKPLGPTVALARGGQFVAFDDGDAVKILSRFAAKGEFKIESAPLLADASKARPIGPSFATDGDGKPALLYALAAKEGEDTLVALAHPGAPDAVKITDANGIANESGALSLAFAGSKARAAVVLSRGGAEKSPLYFLASDDEKTWSRVNVAPDGSELMAGQADLAVTDSSAAIVTIASGGNLDGTKCGEPKLARSADLKSFETCSPDADRTLGLAPTFAALAFDAGGKLFVAMDNPAGDKDHGLLVWHE